MQYKQMNDIVYRTIDNISLHVDLILPESIQNTPCAVFFHGGGWTDGSKKDVHGFPLIIDALLENQIAVASVEYRLTNKNGGGFPQSIEDCLFALQFIDKIDGFDPNKKAVWGISAGGYMALMCVLYQSVCKIYSPISAVLDMCGPTILTNHITPQQTIQFIHDFLANNHENTYNPISLLSQSILKPPIMIIHGDCDECVDTDQSRLFYTQATRNGFYTEYIEVENSGHTFYGVNGKSIRPRMQDLLKQMSTFLIEHI